MLAPHFLFDVQVKRLHEYKRQLLNALSIMAIYFELKAGNLPDFTPTAFLFGAKAAPGYDRAKAIIRYINRIAHLINSDPDHAREITGTCSFRTTTAPMRNRSSPPLTFPSRSPLPAPKPPAPAT